MSKAVHCFRQKPGSMIFGRQLAVDEPGPFQFATARSGEIFRHNEVSLRHLVSDVAVETEMKLDVDVSIQESISPQTGQKWKLMRFCGTVQ